MENWEKTRQVEKDTKKLLVRSKESRAKPAAKIKKHEYYMEDRDVISEERKRK